MYLRELVFEARRLVYHSTLGLRVIGLRVIKRRSGTPARSPPCPCPCRHQLWVYLRFRGGLVFKAHRLNKEEESNKEDNNSARNARTLSPFPCPPPPEGVPTQRFRGGLVFKAYRLVYHSTLGLRVIKKKKKRGRAPWGRSSFLHVYLAHKKQHPCRILQQDYA